MTRQKRRPTPSRTHGELTVGRTRRLPCGGLAPCTVRTPGIFAWPPRKNVLDVRCAISWSVRVGECAAVEEGSSSFLGFFGWQTLLVVRFESRLWPDSTTGLFWYKPENRVSLGGTLRRRYAMVHTGKPCLSLRHAEPPVCSCEVQTVEETRRGRCQFPSDGARFQLKRVNWYAEAADSSVDQY